jgi:Zn-dependent M28 family amino/carboxypeptidase
MIVLFRFNIWLIILTTAIPGYVKSQALIEALPKISDSILSVHVNALAHDSMAGRFTGTAAAHNAALYISGQMRQIGLQPLPEQDSSLLVPWIIFPGEKRKDTFNVAGYLPGNKYPDTIIVFSAHLDHIGLQSYQRAFPFGSGSKRVKGDAVYNGANDNATGVAAMLELARVFSETGSAYTLLFVAFSGEELGLRGSARFVPYLDPKTIKQNINLEMLGRPDKKAPFITEGESGEFRNMLNRNLYKQSPDYGKKYFWPDPYPEQKLFERSDNISFHNAGIAANTIMGTSPYDRYYHSAADEVSNINIPAMRDMVQAIFYALVPFLNP